MYHSEVHMEPIEGLEDEAYWYAFNSLQQYHVQRAAAFQKNMTLIKELRENYLQEFQMLLGQEKWAAYQLLREIRNSSAQQRFLNDIRETAPTTGPGENQDESVHDKVQFHQLIQKELGAIQDLQNQYLASLSDAHRRDRLTMPESSSATEPYLNHSNQVRWLCPPFPGSESQTHSDPQYHTNLKNFDVKSRLNLQTGDLQHFSLINLYDAGNSSHIHVENRLGFAAIIEPPSGWTKMYVMAEYQNSHSCATWAQWDECGISSYRQEFTCQGYLRVHEFRPWDHPLIGEALGLELRGTNQGHIGSLILKSNNGTIGSDRPFKNFWLPEERLQTKWIQFDGPFKTKYLAIFSGVDICHLDDANDTSMYSEFLLNLRLRNIAVKFAH
jgi:hypothetical protein